MDYPILILLFEKAINARQSLFDTEHQSAFRLFNGFTEGNPNLVIDVYASTVVFHNYADDAAEGIPIGGGAWERRNDGYAGTGRPDMQHPLTMPGSCPGPSACEDFADMFMNWAQNSFADNDAGRARYDWMDARMGSWVYSSINR